MSKEWYKSKTLWVNLIALIAMIVQSQTGFVIDIEVQAGILAVINFALRIITKQEVNWKKPKSGINGIGYVVLIPLLLLSSMAFQGCKTTILNLTENYIEASSAVKEFARISAEDWLFGSGIIQEALDEQTTPPVVFEVLRRIDDLFKDENGQFVEDKKLNDFELGRTLGARAKLAGPVIKAAIEQYAPALLSIKEVALVLSFIGL